MRPYKKVLIAVVDDSEYGLAAAQKGLALTRQLGADPALAYIMDTRVLSNPELGPSYIEIKGHMETQARETLDELAAMYEGGEVKKYFRESHSLFKEIIKVGRDWSADLIIIGSRQRTGLEHLLMGSVAEHVMRNSPIPIMIVPGRVKS